MDLIGSLVSQLGVDRDAAEGTAGSLLNLLREHAPAEQAQQLTDGVPEAAGWMAKAQAATQGGATPNGGDGLGGLLGGLGGALGAGGGGVGALTTMLGRFGVGADKLGLIIPLLMQFLQSRLGGETASRMTSAVPFLKDLSGGGVLGGLGKILGR